MTLPTCTCTDRKNLSLAEVVMFLPPPHSAVTPFWTARDCPMHGVTIVDVAPICDANDETSVDSEV